MANLLPLSAIHINVIARKDYRRATALFLTDRKASGMPNELFQSIDVIRLRDAIAKIHQQVSCGHGRIELTRSGCDDVCVIVSKADLESLERGLEILAGTIEYKTMCQNVHRLAQACGAPGCDSEMLGAES